MMDRVDDGDDSGGRKDVPTYFPSCNFLFLSFF